MRRCKKCYESVSSELSFSRPHIRLSILCGLRTGPGSCKWGARDGWDWPNPPGPHGMLEGSSPRREKRNPRWPRQSYMFAVSLRETPQGGILCLGWRGTNQGGECGHAEDRLPSELTSPWRKTGVVSGGVQKTRADALGSALPTYLESSPSLIKRLRKSLTFPDWEYSPEMEMQCCVAERALDWKSGPSVPD